MVVKLPSAKKPTEFVGSARRDLRSFPKEVRETMGQAIFYAEMGDKHPDAKPLKGGKDFSGAGVLEVVGRFDGDTYRAVYTVKFSGVVYVLHAFQKKAKRGAATPKADIDLIKLRLKLAKEHYHRVYLKKTG